MNEKYLNQRPNKIWVTKNIYYKRRLRPLPLFSPGHRRYRTVTKPGRQKFKNTKDNVNTIYQKEVTSRVVVIKKDKDTEASWKWLLKILEQMIRGCYYYLGDGVIFLIKGYLIVDVFF